MSSIPAHQVVRSELVRRLGRQWNIGDRLPPVKQLARELGAGQSNTHEAVRQLASEGLLVSRQRQGTFVARLPDLSVQGHSALASGNPLRGRVVTLFGARPDRPPFIQRMVRGFLNELADSGMQVEHGQVENQQFFSPDADALVIFNVAGAPTFAGTRSQHVVMITTAPYQLSTLPAHADAVSVNEHQGGMLAGQAMAASGCRRVCYLAVPMQWRGSRRLDATSSTRLHGFESGWGRTVADEDIVLVPGYSPLSGGKAYRAWRRLASPPSGIFAASDDLAAGFMAEADQHGLRAGVDYQLIGFDGQDRTLPPQQGDLTTVRVPAELMGRRAAQLLRERFINPHRPGDRIYLDCTLHGGQTTALQL